MFDASVIDARASTTYFRMAFPPTVDDLRCGDANAWRWVVDEFVDPLRSYARRFGHSDPDEVVGAVLEAVARRITSFDGGHRELRAFVFSVAHARIVDEFRRRKGRSEFEAHIAADHVPGATAPDAVPPGLLGALDKLPAAQKEVVHLRYIVGLSTAETAVVTARSEDATRAMLSRALQQLRAMMKPVP